MYIEKGELFLSQRNGLPISVQLTNVCGREEIFATHLIILIKSEVSICPIFVSVVVCLKWLYHPILSIVPYISQEACFLFPSVLCNICNIWYMPIACIFMNWSSFSFVCALHYLSIMIQTYLKHWKYKMLVRYILSSVCLRLCKSSQLSFIQYI